MELQRIPVSRLNPAAYNPRIDLKPGDKEYEKLKRSILEFGDVQPIVWNQQTGNIVGGHQRFKILLDMGRTEIDCVVVDMDLEHEKALNIALNKIQGDWDEDKLSSLMAEFDASSFDVSITGFEASEVDALLNKFYSHEAVEDEFDAPAEKEKIDKQGGPSTHVGDRYRLGNHILICADPVAENGYQGLMEGAHAQLAFCVPPVDPKEYAKDGLQPWLERMTAVISHLTKLSDVICWQSSDLSKTGTQFIEPLAIHSHRLFSDASFRPLWLRIWKMTGNLPTADALQSSSTKPTTQFNYLEAFAGEEQETYNEQEFSWLSAFAAHSFQFVRRLTREERRRWGYAGVWEVSLMRRGQQDEIMIPVELPWRCIKMHTDLHSIVLDPYSGLGSTLIACEQSGRACRSLEPDPMHCDLIVRRWEQFTGEKAEKM